MDFKMKKQELVDITPEPLRWDFKRIFIGVGLLILFVIMGNYFFVVTGEKVLGEKQIKGSTIEQGVSVSPVPELPTKEDAIKILQEAQKNLESITEQNLPASGAAIAKIISDLQALQGGKKSAGDVFCELVCKK
jgi:hypothetical protein